MLIRNQNRNVTHHNFEPESNDDELDHAEIRNRSSICTSKNSNSNVEGGTDAASLCNTS